MKSDQIEIVGTLRSRIKELIALYEKAKAENKRILDERDQIRAQIDIQNAQINELEQKYNTLKTAKLLLAGSENGNDAKIKVKKIVREIDKCIALLNR
jgi:chromosome segregation ATPase